MVTGGCSSYGDTGEKGFLFAIYSFICPLTQNLKSSSETGKEMLCMTPRPGWPWCRTHFFTDFNTNVFMIDYLFNTLNCIQ